MTLDTAMILAAGRGERMRPLTDHTPKPLLEVAGKPLIVHHLEALADAGFKRVVVNHAWHGDKITDSLGDGSQFGLDIIYSAEQTALETAGGIAKALPLLCNNGQSHFAVVNADVFTDYDFARLHQTLPNPSRGDLAHLVLIDNPEHNPEGDFVYHQGRVVHALHKAPRLTFAGIACYHKRFFEAIKADVMPLAPLLKAAIAGGRVSAEQHLGSWFDIGTPQRLTQVNELVSARSH